MQISNSTMIVSPFINKINPRKVYMSTLSGSRTRTTSITVSAPYVLGHRTVEPADEDDEFDTTIFRRAPEKIRSHTKRSS